MLKGLKKSKPTAMEEDNTNRVRSNIDQNAIKEEQMREQMQEIPNLVNAIQQEEDREEKQKYQHCFRLFLAGRTEQLEDELQKLKEQIAKKCHSHAPLPIPTKNSKFDYNMSFSGAQDAKQIKKQIKKRNRPIMASNRVQDYCRYCPDNEDLCLLSASNYAYLAFPKEKTFDGLFHLILAPVDHQQTSIGLNQDVLTEINNYRKCLIQAFDKYDLQVVFFQQFSSQNSHIYIECLALPRGKADDLPFFFKQALEDVQGNWGTHRSIIRIQKDKGGIQKQIPKQMNYFYIDFANGHGFAHVIENQRQWKRDFCNSVMATALNIQPHKVKTSETYSPEEYAKKREVFDKIWKPFDWTQLI